MQNVPKKYTELIANALAEYELNRSTNLDKTLAREYTDYMLQQIKPNFQ